MGAAKCADGKKADAKSALACPNGFEPSASSVGGLRSIQLSYGHIFAKAQKVLRFFVKAYSSSSPSSSSSSSSSSEMSSTESMS